VPWLEGGKQKKLSIAQTFALKPDIIIKDEPCSALDPISTHKIEERMRDLSQDYTIIIVTHNTQQAARVSENTAIFTFNNDRAGTLLEYGLTSDFFTKPTKHIT
jgi:phosphate transport system ATP-binding protein